MNLEKYDVKLCSICDDPSDLCEHTDLEMKRYEEDLAWDAHRDPMEASEAERRTREACETALSSGVYHRIYNPDRARKPATGRE